MTRRDVEEFPGGPLAAGDSADHRLRHELVPRPLWGVSLCRQLKGVRWDRLRRSLVEAAGGRCECCGEARDRGMVCHEVWAYDDDASVATLVGFRIICPACNFVTHRGMASRIDRGDQADEHMAQVNGVSLEEARRLYWEAFAMWRERSERPWAVMIDQALVERHPVLEGVELVAETVGVELR